MAVRVYLLPTAPMPPGHPPGVGPKYFVDGTIPVQSFQSRRYGTDDLYLVEADTTDSTHALLISKPDVLALDAASQKPIDTPVLTALTGMKSAGMPLADLTGKTDQDAIAEMKRVIFEKQAGKPLPVAVKTLAPAKKPVPKARPVAAKKAKARK